MVTLSSLNLNSRKVKKELTTYTVEEVKGTDGTVTYDAMKAECNSRQLNTMEQLKFSSANVGDIQRIKSSTTR